MSPVRAVCHLPFLLLALGALFASGCDDGTSSNTGGPADSAANIVYIHNDSTEPYVIDDRGEEFDAIVTPYAGSWIAAGGGVFTSSNGGDDWERQTLPDGVSVQALSSNPQGISIGVGYQDRIVYSTNSGYTWDTATIHGGRGSADLRAVANDFSNLAIAVGDEASIYRSTNGGVTWDPVQIPGNASPYFNAVCLPSPSTAVVVGDGGAIMRSTDAGDSWHEVTVSGVDSRTLFNGIASATPTTMMIVGQQVISGPGKILLSTDGGRTWSDRTTADFTTASLMSVSYGYTSWWIAGSEDNGGALWKSSDNGASWRKVPIRFGVSELQSIKMIGDEQGFAVGRPVVY